MFEKHKKKVLALAAVSVVALPLAAQAATTNLTATATFLTAITMTATDMAFGNIEVTGTGPLTATVAMDTTGARTCTGAFACTGAGTAGDVTINTASAQPLDVYCSATAVLGDTGSETIPITAVTVRPEGAGSDSSCNGLSGSGTVAASMTYASGSADQLAFGGTIDAATASAGFGAGAYSTATGSGANITVEVFYQ